VARELVIGGRDIMKTTMLLVIVGAGFLSLLLQAWCSGGQGAGVNAIEQLMSQDQKTRMSAHDELLAERQRSIRSLIALIEKKSPDSRWLELDSSENLAIRVLGEMRAVEAIPTLVKWATPPKGGYNIFNLGVSPSNSPAVQALVKIGKPAEPALLEVVKQSPQREIWSISLIILQKIEGPKCLEVILEDAIAKETDAAAKTNLQEGLRRLKSGAGFEPPPGKVEITAPPKS
jgi:hypothetical protein